MKSLIYAGSFDPMHYGHLNIIQRASKLTNELYVAVLDNKNKKYLFSKGERINFAKEITSHIDNVEVVTFDGLLDDYVLKHNIDAIIKGIRNAQDFQYEYNLSTFSCTETICLMAEPEYIGFSSSAIKEYATYANSLEKYVSDSVSRLLIERVR